MRETAQRTATGTDRGGALALAAIRKNFGAVEVMKGVDLASNRASSCVFVGPSGCGKSTLLRMVAGSTTLPRVGSPSAAGMSRACRPRRVASPWCSNPTRSTRT